MLESDRVREAKTAFVEASAALDRARLASTKAEDPDAQPIAVAEAIRLAPWALGSYSFPL